MSRNVTIRDVAKAAGVSITTTSQVLKGVGRYSGATVKRVWDVVNELNYTPNQYAKKFFSGESPERERTGLLMRVTYFPYDDYTLFPLQDNVSEAHRMICFEQACMEHDCSGTNYIYRHRIGFRSRLLLNNLVDGIVLGSPDKVLIENLKQRLPVVLTDINANPEDTGLSVVNADLRSACVQAFTRMRQAGITGKMAVFCGQPEEEKIQSILKEENRTIQLEKAADQCGVVIEKKHYFNIGVSHETNDKVLEQIADRICRLVRKEGVRMVALRYINARNLSRLLKARGLRLPDDVVIMGVNSMPCEQEPGVVQLVYDWEKLMETAVDVLLQTIEKPDRVPGKYLVPCRDVTDSFLRGETEKTNLT